MVLLVDSTATRDKGAPRARGGASHTVFRSPASDCLRQAPPTEVVRSPFSSLAPQHLGRA